MGSVGATTDESKTFKQMVHTRLEHNKCLPEDPPEAIPAAAAAQKVMWTNIT
jgi:hypothetical protein